MDPRATHKKLDKPSQTNFIQGVKLREDPRMTYRGVPSWPPVWCRSGEDALEGEIGILVSADCDRSGSKCFLGMEHNGRRYAGTLLFNDMTFCWLVTRTLKNRTGTAVKDLGDLDLSSTL